MEQALASSPWRANAVSLSKVIEARSRGSSRRRPAIMMATVSAADLPASLAASTKRVFRSLRASTGRVRRQISRSPSQCPGAFRSWTSAGRSWMERRPAMVLRDCRARRRHGAPPGDGAARLPRPPPAAPGPPARQQLPQLLALLPGAVDEGVDRLDRHPTEPALPAALEPAGDPLRRPALQQALAHEPAELGVALEDGLALPALAVAALGVHRQVAAPGQRVPPQFAADGRGRPAELPRDRPQAEPLGLQRGQPLPLLQLQMRPARHRPIPNRHPRPGPYHKAQGCCASRRTPPLDLLRRHPRAVLARPAAPPPPGRPRDRVQREVAARPPDHGVAVGER